MPVYRDDNIDDILDGLDDAVDTGVRKAAEAELENIVTHWERGQDALGRPWIPNALSTTEQKGHSRPNIDTGATKRSGEVLRGDDGTVMIHFGGWIAYLEFGTETAPARPVLRPGKAHLRRGLLQETVANQIQQYLDSLSLTLSLGGHDV